MNDRVYRVDNVAFNGQVRSQSPAEKRRLEVIEQRLQANERKNRELDAKIVRKRAERVVDQAIRERRLEAGDRDEWISRFERDPDLVSKVLTDLNPAAPKMLYSAADFGEASAASFDELATRLGIRPGDVI